MHEDMGTTKETSEEVTNPGESQPDQQITNLSALKEFCSEYREDIRDKGQQVRALISLAQKAREVGEETHYEQIGEIIANIMLAFRHLEDARMRIGKAIQQVDGGVSILDKLEYPGKAPVEEKPVVGGV